MCLSVCVCLPWLFNHNKKRKTEKKFNVETNHNLLWWWYNKVINESPYFLSCPISFIWNKRKKKKQIHHFFVCLFVEWWLDSGHSVFQPSFDFFLWLVFFSGKMMFEKNLEIFLQKKRVFVNVSLTVNLLWWQIFRFFWHWKFLSKVFFHLATLCDLIDDFFYVKAD